MTNRELASVVLLAVVLAFGMGRADVRRAFRGVLRAFLNWRILTVITGYALYVAFWIWTATNIGLWDSSLLKDTIFWFVLAGFPLLFKSDQAGTSERFFRDTARSTVELGVFFGFFVNLVSLDLPWELALQFVLAVLVMTRIVAVSESKYESARRLIDVLLVVIGVAMSVYTARVLYDQRRILDVENLAHSLLMTIWLPLVSLLFIFCFSLVAEYELAFIRMRFGGTKRRNPSFGEKLAVVVGLNVHVRDVHAFTGGWGGRVNAASTFYAGISEVRAFRKSRRDREEQERKTRDELRRFSGVTGVDEKGRQLDRREFVETQNALRWVATCQMGHYRSRNGSYRPDLMEILKGFTSYGLPKDHGVELTVHDDGQAWRAWRRTVSGWVFAIGAASNPPDQWLYDGPEPPANFPSANAGWDHFAPRDAAINW